MSPPQAQSIAWIDCANHSTIEYLTSDQSILAILPASPRHLIWRQKNNSRAGKSANSSPKIWFVGNKLLARGLFEGWGGGASRGGLREGRRGDWKDDGLGLYSFWSGNSLFVLMKSCHVETGRRWAFSRWKELLWQLVCHHWASPSLHSVRLGDRLQISALEKYFAAETSYIEPTEKKLAVAVNALIDIASAIYFRSRCLHCSSQC